MLPSELAHLSVDPPSGRRRTSRDWAADLILFGAAAAFWLSERNQDPDSYVVDQPDWILTADPWIGAAACLALWARRRFPLVLVWAMVPLLFMSSTATGAIMVAILTVAIRRRWQVAALATLPYLVMGIWFGYAYPDPELSRFATMVTVALMFTAPLGWGIAIRARRQLVIGLHLDAERERREHELRLSGSRRAERERIAREMHDVLAHRISLLSVHAGALAYRTTRAEAGTGPSLDQAEIGAAVSVMRDNANQALAELGDVLKVLRSDDDIDDDVGDDVGGGDADGADIVEAEPAPQPRLADISRLISEAEGAGQQVTFNAGAVLQHGDSMRPQAQRTAYRVVQEGLTNARKHAPGAPVAVSLSGESGGELAVTVENPLPAWTASEEVPGAQVGLTGLAERVMLDGGTLEHGREHGTFRLHARLPWPDDRGGNRASPGAARR
jgi:signal transduction histidine kinase